MIKKILYIAFKYEYGKKENGIALNYKAWFENFKKLNYDVEGIFFEDYSHKDLQENIIKKAKEFRPDLIFFILQKDQIDIDTLKKLQKSNFFTACFFGDDQWRFDNWTYKYAPYLSVCITTDKFSIDKYKKIGQNNVIYSQWASLDSNIDYNNVDYKYDVSFIGGANPYRKWFVKRLEKKGIKVECFGNGWKNGRISYEEMEKIFCYSKINLNIPNSTNYDIRFLSSSLKGLASLIKNSITGTGKDSSQMKARNFEIPVNGGFQLTDYVPTLEEYFDIGKEIVCYSSVDEAEKLIKYYLKHEDEREAIKIAGIKRARNEHTFKHRIINFMKEINKIYDNKR